MADVKSSNKPEPKQQTKASVPIKKTMVAERRHSNRLASKKHDNATDVRAHTPIADDADNLKSGNKDVLQFFTAKMDMILEGISRLGIDSTSGDLSKAAITQCNKNNDIGNTSVSSSYDSDRTVGLVPLAADNEGSICEQLFRPVKDVPKPADLRKALLNEPVVKIPIHQYVFDRLKEDVPVSELESYFCIVENVGNIAPQLTPRVETALLVNNVDIGTESMQQHVLDAFLMGVIGTAQEYLGMDVMIDRNAAEPSMTLPQSRPDYLLLFNGLLVFKGEEKKGGNVRQIALELTDKMADNAVGRTGKLEYLLCYATAGSRVLFECIYEENKMVECADIINLKKVSDRVTMLIILINVVRIAHSLYLARRIEV